MKMRKGEDDNQFAIKSVHVVDDEKLVDSLQNVVPPGGAEPDLNLAESPGFNVASGVSYQPMPTPVKPDIKWPDLSGSPDCGGYDSMNPSPPAPDLAGCGGGFSTPASGPIQPDYGVPDFASLNQGLKGTSDDLAQARLNYAYGGEFEPDPSNPDLTGYNKPMGLDFYPESYANLWQPDPTLDGDVMNPDIPNGIHGIRDPEQPDPQLPDLQDPQFSLDIQMQGRPGEMDPNAMNVLHSSPDFDATKGVAYDLSYIVQGGSTRRGRKMDMIMHGLDGDL
jgi:hypothetical protein